MRASIPSYKFIDMMRLRREDKIEIRTWKLFPGVINVANKKKINDWLDLMTNGMNDVTGVLV